MDVIQPEQSTVAKDASELDPEPKRFNLKPWNFYYDINVYFPFCIYVFA